MAARLLPLHAAAAGACEAVQWAARFRELEMNLAAGATSYLVQSKDWGFIL